MNKLLIILSVILLTGCNIQKYIAKHPELIPADTVKIEKETIKYEREFITNDSIVFKEIPCDPIDSIIYKTRTIYKTRNVLKVDTIYSSKEVSKVNPLNTQLQKDFLKYQQKAENKNKVIYALIIIIVVLLLLYKIFS